MISGHLKMSTRLRNLCLKQMKFYCTKNPTDSIFEKSLKALKVGDQMTVTKIITEDDILTFAKLVEDYNPIHIKSPRNIVHGAYLNGLISGVLGTKLPGPGTIVVEQVIKYPKPCYEGDTVSLTVEILSVRKIIRCKYTCIANMERLVLEGEARLVLRDFNLKKISFTK